MENTNTKNEIEFSEIKERFGEFYQDYYTPVDQSNQEQVIKSHITMLTKAKDFISWGEGFIDPNEKEYDAVFIRAYVEEYSYFINYLFDLAITMNKAIEKKKEPLTAEEIKEIGESISAEKTNKFQLCLQGILIKFPTIVPMLYNLAKRSDKANRPEAQHLIRLFESNKDIFCKNLSELNSGELGLLFSTYMEMLTIADENKKHRPTALINKADAISMKELEDLAAKLKPGTGKKKITSILTKANITPLNPDRENQQIAFLYPKNESRDALIEAFQNS